MRNCDEGIVDEWPSFYTPLGTPSSRRLVTVGCQPLERRLVDGRWDSRFESNDVFKEYKTVFILKGKMNGYFVRDSLQDLVL